MKVKLSKREKIKLKKEKKEKRIKKKINRKEKIKKLNLSSLIGGMFVGIANIIPGVSGGTMLVIFNLFDKLMYSISDIFKRKTDTRKESIVFVLKVLLGAVIGIVLFAKILGFTLKYMEAETIFWFMGLILFSVPIIVKEELKGEKFSIISFILGIGIIAILQYLKLQNPENSEVANVNTMHYILLIVYGMIAGITMVFPGISGSMVLLVLGKYEMIRSYVDKLTTFKMDVIINLVFFAIGAALGIILSAKLTSLLLKKHKSKTMSVILGFIIASALILPFNIENKIIFETQKVCGLIVSFVLGGIVIYYINRLQQKNLKNNL